MISLYPYQEKAKGEIRTHFKNERKRVLLQMPTGAGKTRTFCSLISDLFNADDQFRCILVAHVDELLLQIGETLSEYG
jgi:superfamily II DNA or RNA helicase